jgi:hypothetical protein
MIAALNTSGLILNAAGVLLLFYFGMPYRTRTEGKHPRTFVLLDRDKIQKTERRYDQLGRLGLLLILLGTVLQVCANWLL